MTCLIYIIGFVCLFSGLGVTNCYQIPIHVFSHYRHLLLAYSYSCRGENSQAWPYPLVCLFISYLFNSSLGILIGETL